MAPNTMFLETFVLKQNVLLLLKVAFWQRVPQTLSYHTIRPIDALRACYSVAMHLVGVMVVPTAGTHRLTRAHWLLTRCHGLSLQTV